jgi:hypothetical protein
MPPPRQHFGICLDDSLAPRLRCGTRNEQFLAAKPNAAHYVGLALIAAGILSAWRYRQLIRYPRSEKFHAIAGSENEVQMPLLLISLSLTVIGLFAFGAVFTGLV